MPRPYTASLLHDVLAGRQLSAHDIDDLLRAQVREDLHLEYKSREFLRKSDAAALVRKYVSGFANSDGGLLLLGVVGHPASGRSGWCVDGCPNDLDPANPLNEWASRAIGELAHLLGSPARIQLIRHADGDVLMIAVAPAPSLVPTTERNRPAHFIRIEDQTLRAPEYLHADIVLGRRRRPQLTLDLEVAPESLRTFSAPINIELTLTGKVTNESLVWLTKAVGGCIGYGSPDQAQPRPSRALRSYVSIAEEVAPWGHSAGVVVWQASLQSVPPFAHYGVTFCPKFPISRDPLIATRWQGVVFMVPENSTPSFWQVDLTCDARPRIHSFALHPLDPGVAGIVRLSAS